MAARRRRRNSGGPAWVWLLTGLLIGAGVPALMLYRGYLPAPRTEPAAPVPSPASDEPALVQPEPEAQVDEGPRYDFFTVLPEMEVVVPEQQLEEEARPEAVTPDEGQEAFILQAGSFRSAEDAEQMKAQLALLGVVAEVQGVTVNGETWHRVRVGPVAGARAADELRRQLQDNGVDTLVMRAP